MSRELRNRTPDIQNTKSIPPIFHTRGVSPTLLRHSLIVIVATRRYPPVPLVHIYSFHSPVGTRTLVSRPFHHCTTPSLDIDLRPWCLRLIGTCHPPDHSASLIYLRGVSILLRKKHSRQESVTRALHHEHQARRTLEFPNAPLIQPSTDEPSFPSQAIRFLTKMQFEPDFRLNMDDGFDMYSQSVSCPSTATSFSSASSAYDPFTPSSRRSTPNELSLDLDGTCAYTANQSVELTPPSTSMSKYFMGPIKQEPEQISFSESLPTTPMKKMDGFDAEYDLLDMNMVSHHSMGTITPSNSFGMNTISPGAAMGPTSYMMTPTQSLSGSEVADTSSSWSVTNESPIHFFQQTKDLSFNDMDALELEYHSQSPMGHYQLHSTGSPNSMRMQRKMMLHEAQRKTSELQRAQIRASRKRAGKPDSGAVDVVRRAMCKCDYPGCNKAFRRNEHLKRHKQT